MILGISASGRKDGITSKTVKAILAASELEYEYISLSGKRINGCTGCTLCAGDNRCKIQDDWNEIGEKMQQAEAIVFGAPNYAGIINALGHACLERTFCFRHQGTFSLSGKFGVSVSTSPPVNSIIQGGMLANKMSVIGSVIAQGYSQCYTCGFGHTCAVGNVVKDHGFLDRIEKQHCPPSFEKQKGTIIQAKRIGKSLKETLQKPLSQIQI